MSAQPVWKDDQEKYAFYRRRDHSNIEALQNLVIAEIAQLALAAYMKAQPESEDLPDFTMPPNVRHLISALQGAHGGGTHSFEEFERDYHTIGRQLQFTGSDDAIRSRVRSWIDTLDDWQYSVGFQLFVIRKGGDIIGTRSDGTPIRKKTSFIDYLKPRVDEGVQRARFSEQWRGNEENGIKPHPGMALAAQVSSVIKNLPTLGSREESGAEKKVTTPQPVTEYAYKQELRLCDSAEKVADEIEKRGGDADLWLEKVEIELSRRRLSRFKTRPARLDKDSLATVQDMHSPSATTNTCKSDVVCNTCKSDVVCGPAIWSNAESDQPVVVTGDLGIGADGRQYVSIEGSASGVPLDELRYGSQSEAEDGLCKTDLTQGFIGVFEDSASEEEPNLLEWALMWASRGIPVFPLHEVYDGVCTCTCFDHRKKGVPLCKNGNHVCGSECESKGKHPRTDFKLGLRGGVVSGTTDPERIKLLWGKYPTANIGGRMGSASGFFGVDQDPKNGGNASLTDLCDAHGHEWLETWRNISGSGGDHFIYELPEGMKLPNSASKVAPGIDTRGENGYLVMPPSLHTSGQRYKVVEPREFLPVPQFIIDVLTMPENERKVVIEFQEKRGHVNVGNSQEKFMDGQRNDGLFRNGFGRWTHASANSEAELLNQLLEVNNARCVPPLDVSEVEQMVAHIARDYASKWGIYATEVAVA